jgi:hypothetical protein
MLDTHLVLTGQGHVVDSACPPSRQPRSNPGPRMPWHYRSALSSHPPLAKKHITCVASRRCGPWCTANSCHRGLLPTFLRSSLTQSSTPRRPFAVSAVVCGARCHGERLVPYAHGAAARIHARHVPWMSVPLLSASARRSVPPSVPTGPSGLSSGRTAGKSCCLPGPSRATAQRVRHWGHQGYR